MATKSADTKITAELRDSFGKGFARRLRAAGKIPAVIYGHGTDPVHVALPGHETALIVRRANVVLEIEVDGSQVLALVKDIQRDPVRQIIEHIDLLVVIKGEKVEVDIPVIITGEPAAGMNVNVDANTVLLEVEATHIPQSVEVSVEGLEAGAHITAADIKLPSGAVLVVDPETLIVAISSPAGDGDIDEIAEADAAIAAEQAAESAEAAE
ncbi:large subunit ribosomal protein L25 [Microbacterium endophyticum]|uniref:Large ribosomal subunit protein bL25 n=1 Tax=Microbacterium endophyticum TaxID=1526412 RepID=A0A7W4V103_9MICO|nr:50S ribosomal protein L25/general stress protein Ctc [Microbacterium endophyticum]MBB2974871.1 large subunit ribosomal protein L25 [Microbacterium endophyticum]NIK37168.1 large subunit ribosomal protein L25 [Microbacterium endophyticum]